jgi:hypothetical protein
MTYIYETLNTSQIANALRQDQYAAWSHEGARALAEYLEELAENMGEPMELDVVAIRCDFSEYASIEDVIKEYEDIKDLEDLRDNTTVIEFDGGLIVQGF